MSRTFVAPPVTVMADAVGDCELGSGVIGKQVRNQFISNQAVQKHQIQVQPGNIIKFEFNRYGNICRVEVS